MNFRRLVFFSALIALCLGLALPAPAAAQDYDNNRDYSHARIVRLSLVEGDVQVRRPEAEDWEQALLNLPIQQGYTLATSRGRAEVELESGATIRLAENSSLEFTELALADGARITRVALTQGTATFYANLSRKDVFRVTTSFVDVEIPDNARFRLDALEGGSTVSVLKGDVRVEAAGSSYKVTKGRSLVFQEAATDQVTMARSAEPDEWDRWVADRDEVVSTARDSTLRYVNAPFRYGLAELTSYGTWYPDPSFGYIWMPQGISSGWSPYFLGRWLFVSGFGWTWVSYEPWGWVPYHYGRWVLTRRGWAWVPSNFGYWHPGLVAWTTFGGHIGWCPLGPRDRIGSRFHRPQGGVVITNTPGGVVGGTPNGNTNLSPDARPQFTSRAPLSTDPRNRLPRGLDPPDQEIVRGAGAPSGSAVVGSGGSQPTTSNPAARPSVPTATGEPGIVYDGEEKRFVNNPRRPVRPAVEIDPAAPVNPGSQPAAPSQPRATPTPPRDTEAVPARPSTPPVRPSWGNRPPEPRTPRTEPRPSYTPPPRTETPRPSYTPPPRTETPRPSAPPPRAETPRPPSPPPQPRAEPAPRPSPPQQQPRGESRPQKP